MGFQDAVKSGFTNAFDYSGRATRPEYWYFTLFVALCDLAVSIGMMVVGYNFPHMALVGPAVVRLIILLVLMVPHLAVAVRRLHDTDHSGWWYGGMLASFVAATILNTVLPITGLIVGLVALVLLLIALWWLVSRGTADSNRFGPPQVSLPVTV